MTLHSTIFRGERHPASSMSLAGQLWSTKVCTLQSKVGNVLNIERHGHGMLREPIFSLVLVDPRVSTSGSCCREYLLNTDASNAIAVVLRHERRQEGP